MLSKSVLIGIITTASLLLIGCGGETAISQAELPNYGLVISGVSDYGEDIDTDRHDDAIQAGIAYINGKVRTIATSSVNLKPGDYDIQVGLRCGDSRTCRPGKAYKITVKAGYRYVLKPDGVYVSNRSIPRDKTKEARYNPNM